MIRRTILLLLLLLPSLALFYAVLALASQFSSIPQYHLESTPLFATQLQLEIESRLLPFPIPPTLPSTILLINITTLFIDNGGDDILLLTSLAGQLSKNALSSTRSQAVTLLYAYSNASPPTAQALIQSYKKHYPSINYQSPEPNITALVTQFKNTGDITSYILSDSHSVNLAVSLASINARSIVVSANHLPLMNKLGLQQVGDVRGEDETEFFKQFLPPNHWPFSTRFFTSNNENLTPRYLSDLTILLSSFQLYNLTTFNLLLSSISAIQLQAGVIDSLDTPVKLWAMFGWTPNNEYEDYYVYPVSQAGGMVFCSDTIDNFATHIWMRNQATPQMQNPTNRPRSTPLPNTKNKHVVAFLFTDGDSISEDIGNLANLQHWLDPRRGSFPLAFGLDSSLVHFGPGLLQWWYDTVRTENDTLVAFAPAYAYPDAMANYTRQLWAEAAGEVMQYADTRITYFIGDADGGKTWNTTQFAPLLQQWNIDACIYLPYLYYYVLPKGAGSVLWLNGKPCISARESLWAGHMNSTQIAALLNKQSVNGTTADGYSVIVVEANNQVVQDVINVINELEDHVIVVRLDDLIRLLVNNVKGSNRMQHM